MTEFKSYRCPVCGKGTVAMRPADGQTRQFMRGVVRQIPSTVLLPTCDSCAEVFMGPEDSERVDGAMRSALRTEQPMRLQALVDAMKLEYGATQREIEQACAVTPSYLSHVLNGRRLTSETLVRLMEAFAVCRAEFERYRTGVATRPHPLDAALFERSREQKEGFSISASRVKYAPAPRGHPDAQVARKGASGGGEVLV